MTSHDNISPEFDSEYNIYYKCPVDEHLQRKFEQIDELNRTVEQNRPLEGDLMNTIEEKFFIEWTYNSNALEGSTLTQGETMFFLKYGLTVEGKPLKDFLDARNHAEAIQFLYDVVKNRRDISPALLKEFNALLLSGVTSVSAIDRDGRKIEKRTKPGAYKILPNHVLQLDGKIHKYVEPEQVAQQMEILCNWINQNLIVLHPVIVAAIAHYNMARIHPFDDGNGRGTRLLMNLILLKKGLPPAIIKNEKRRFYIESLASADKGELLPFVNFIADSCVETLEIMKRELGV